MESEALTEQRFYVLELERDNQDSAVTGWHFAEVEAIEVDLGFGFRAFVSNCNKVGTEPAFWRKANWKVFHLETGSRMTDSFDTKEAAIKNAKERIASNHDEYQSSLEFFVAKYGASPAGG